MPHVLEQPGLVLSPAVVPVFTSIAPVVIAILGGVAVTLAGILARMLKPAAMKAALRFLWRVKLHLLAGAAVVFVAGWGVKALLARAGGPVTAAEGGGDWPMARGGPARRGWAGGPGPVRGGVEWVWQQGGEGFLASAAVRGNRVYIASAQMGAFGESGTLYCLDADTGGQVWAAAPKGFRPTFSSPVLAGDRLVCGEGLHVTRDARVVCLDLSPGREGLVLWTFRTTSHVECTPLVADGRVYVGAGDDGYYCLALEAGPDGEAQVLWHAPGDRYPDAETALLVHEGRVYAGLGLGGRALCVLDAVTGEEMERIETPYPVFGPPSTDGRTLFLAMGTGDYVNTAEQARQARLDKARDAGATEEELDAMRARLGPAGEIWGIDLETLKVRWRAELPRTVLGSVAVADGELYAASRDGCVYAYTTDGKPVARWDSHAPIVASPAVTEDRVYVMTTGGRVYGLARPDLAPVWELAVSTGGLAISSPVVARGHLYVGTQNDGLVCAGLPPEEGAAAYVWPGGTGAPGQAGNADRSPLPPLGAFLWQYPADQMGETEAAVVPAAAAPVPGGLLVPLAGEGRQGLAKLPLGAGEAEAPEPAWVHETPGPVVAGPAVAAGAAHVLHEGAGGGAALDAVDLETGERRWQATLEGAPAGLTVGDAGEAYVRTADGRLMAFDAAGGALWTRALGWLAGPPAVTPTMVLAASAEDGSLTAMDRPTGAVLWAAALEAAPTTGPVVAGDAVFVGTEAGVAARSLVDGRAVEGWTVGGGAVAAPLALTPEALVTVTADGHLLVVSRTGGQVRHRVAGAAPGVAPLVARGRVLFAGADALRVLDLEAEDAKATPWVDTSWLGRPAGPMLLVGSRVYQPRTGWGLVCFGACR